MEPRHLVLVRHGESQLNAANRLQRIYCGQIETPLTETGRQQALDAVHKINHLKYLRLRRAISSPLERAAETLRLILSRWSDSVETLSPSPGLMERCHGVFEGKSEDEVFLS